MATGANRELVPVQAESWEANSDTTVWTFHIRPGLQWSDGTATYDSSPEASAGRKFQAWLARVLPIDSQL